MGSGLARVKCGTSEVLFAGGQVVFLRDLPFLPHLMTWLKISEIILSGRKPLIERMSMCMLPCHSELLGQFRESDLGWNLNKTLDENTIYQILKGLTIVLQNYSSGEKNAAF